ncbi:MAG: UDP-N-acetylmuramoyl-L-alanyl-D-glutamate--2,6-diaminopimelate ligase [Oleibacter sp.]|nr:UDP-N-acetylmuramoyl-L-alanyl-D-glutamate--2,6-diaminopimelate ligase [Thalassolituus sp.]
MKLSQIAQDSLMIPPEWDRDIQHIRCDSRDIQVGDLFIARSGSEHNSNVFIKSAIAAGAVAVFLEKTSEDTPYFRCDDGQVPVFSTAKLRSLLPLWLANRYLAAKQIPLIGVTGTNGKSSVTQYIAQLLKCLNSSCGVLGTLGNGVWPTLEATRNTTPDISIIYQNIEQIKSAGASHVAMEVSSHGLDQKRVEGLVFDVSILTNISQDHLDYHGTMENYFASKASLFTADKTRAAVINIDDVYGRRLLETLKSTDDKQISTISVSYIGAFDDDYDAQKALEYNVADVCYYNIERTQSGQVAQLKTPWGNAEMTLSLLGDFNVANMTAAVSALVLMGYPFDDVINQTKFVQPIAGRMEVYCAKEKPLAVIDFAHTPDAISNVLNSLMSDDSELSLVFGCGGERDRSKRALMADAASIATNVWVTDDNPRRENSDQIFDDIRQSKASRKYQFIHNRTEAINAAIESTSVHGVVVIAGKGHENYQHIGNEKISYSDADVLASLGYQKLGGHRAA